MAAMPKFIEPKKEQKKEPVWIINGRLRSVERAKKRIQMLTAIAEKAIAGM